MGTGVAILTDHMVPSSVPLRATLGKCLLLERRCLSLCQYLSPRNNLTTGVMVFVLTSLCSSAKEN